MRITCPNCTSGYDVPDGAIGPTGRKVRCRACGASWHQPGQEASGGPADPILAGPASLPTPAAGQAIPISVTRTEPSPPDIPPPIVEIVPADPLANAAPSTVRRASIKGPFLALGLVLLALLLGGAIALITFGPGQVATGLGLSDRRVPLGIAITRQPDWRMIAGGSELFAVSGRIWNPTQEEQAIPDIRAELKDAAGKTVYSWTITRPQARLAAGKSIDFDAAAVDVPRTSSKIAVSFAGTGG